MNRAVCRIDIYTGEPFLVDGGRLPRRPMLFREDGRLIGKSGRELGYWYVSAGHSHNSVKPYFRRDKLNDPITLARLRLKVMEHAATSLADRRAVAIERCRQTETPYFMSGDERRNLVFDDYNERLNEEVVKPVSDDDALIEQIAAIPPGGEDEAAGGYYHQTDRALGRAWMDAATVRSALELSFSLCAARMVPEVLKQPAWNRNNITFVIDGQYYPYPTTGDQVRDHWPRRGDHVIDLNTADLSVLSAKTHNPMGRWIQVRPPKKRKKMIAR